MKARIKKKKWVHRFGYVEFMVTVVVKDFSNLKEVTHYLGRVLTF